MFCFWWFAIIGKSGTGTRVSIESSMAAADIGGSTAVVGADR
jgi:hypothetical protein